MPSARASKEVTSVTARVAPGLLDVMVRERINPRANVKRMVSSGYTEKIDI